MSKTKHPQAVRLYLCGGGKPHGLVPRRADGTYETPDVGDYKGMVTDYIEVTIRDGGIDVRVGEGVLQVEPHAGNHIRVCRRDY